MKKEFDSPREKDANAFLDLISSGRENHRSGMKSLG